MNRRDFVKLAGASLATWLAWPAAEALARAGGGTSTIGGGSSRSSSSSGYSSSSSSYRYRSGSSRVSGSLSFGELFPLMLGLVAAYLIHRTSVSRRGATAAVAAAFARQRSHDRADGQELLRRIAREDDAWSPEHMRARVEAIYHKVQEAWTERNQAIARGFMSPRLYARHKRMTDEMREQGRRNVLEDVRLLDCDIVHVADRKGTQDDEFWAVITGSMIDYEVRDDGPAAGLVNAVQQLRTPPKRFQELWKFTRDDQHGWVLDKIEQDIGAGMAQARVFSQEAG